MDPEQRRLVVVGIVLCSITFAGDNLAHPFWKPLIETGEVCEEHCVRNFTMFSTSTSQNPAVLKMFAQHNGPLDITLTLCGMYGVPTMAGMGNYSVTFYFKDESFSWKPETYGSVNGSFHIVRESLMPLDPPVVLTIVIANDIAEYLFITEVPPL